MEEHKPLTVTQLTGQIKELLESGFPRVSVVGEVMGFKRHSSGHLYFTLKDSGARLAAMVFRSQTRFLALRLNEIRDGLQVRCQGRLNLYEPHGAYKIIVDQMQQEGQGALLEALEARKRKLAAEGLFDRERKQPLPLVPGCVGIVTAHTGAAIQDMLRTMEERFPVPVKLYPATVQGEGAAADIVQGIERLDADPEVSVIIVGRGGGAFEDLLPFSDEAVVRAVAACRTPIVSAVGHEVDSPLSDLAADERALTPTGAAQLVVPERAALQQHFREARQKMERALERQLTDAAVALADREERLVRAVDQRLERTAHQVTRLSGQLAAAHPASRLERTAERLVNLRSHLDLAMARTLERRQERLTALAGLLEQLGPSSQFKRGYALVRRPDGRAVTRHDQVSPGDALDIVLHEGSLAATVDETRPAGE